MDERVNDDEDERRRLEVKNELAKWAIECGIPRTHISRLLVILKKCNELSHLPKDYRTLLKTVRNVVTKEVALGTYFHFGLSNGIIKSLFHLSLPTIPKEIKLFINIDGIPLVKSSNSQFWPILGIIRGYNGSKPFVIGIFHGNTKPTDSNEYLQQFVEEAIQLEREGLIIGGSTVIVSISGFICDFPAKSFICRVKGHTGYFGCTKCETEGVHYNPNINNPNSGRVIFPQLNALLRTDQSFRDKLQPEHHQGITLLEQLDIDLISGVPLDPMHLTDLGITRKLFVSWIRGKYRNVKLSRDKKNVLAKRIEKVRSYIPDDFPRKLGPLDLLDRWKSTCFRLIKLRL